MSGGKAGKRQGYTTGTCAAAAAKAAVFMLLTGHRIDRIELRWQPGKDLSKEAQFEVEDPVIGPDVVRCAVRKDAGDDIDVTDGLLIYAEVSRLPDLDDALDPSEELKEDVVPVFPEDMGEPEPDEKKTKPMIVSLSDLEDDNGIIPLRWDKAADYLEASVSKVPELSEKDSAELAEEKKPSGRILSLADDGSFSASEWSLIREFFRTAGESWEQEPPYAMRRSILSEQERFLIRGGEGIGIVTKPGLDQPPGEAAINSGPRRMIREAVVSVCDSCEYEGRLQITISAPGGEALASRTFNPRLGIEGGISILGTTGIVEPRSGRAVSETVRAEVRVKAASSKALVFVPGNTGSGFVQRELLVPEDKIVIMSNYPGDALEEAGASGVKRVLITGSLGKLIKLAGGIFYTHSQDADARMDILMRCALQSGAPISVLRGLDGCVTTEAGLELLEQNGMLERTAEVILNRAITYTRHRAEDLQVEMIILRNTGEVLAFSDEAFSLMMEEQDA